MPKAEAIQIPNPNDYDRIIVGLSGGKDSIASTLATSRVYPRDEIIVEEWKLPAGAYKACGGPV